MITGFKNLLAPFACLLWLANTGHAQTFPARAQVNLCPDYRLGGTTVEFGFRIGPTPFNPIPIASMNVDSSSNTATVDLNLPAIFGTNRMSVVAFCRNAYGVSTNSNQIDISNCNSLGMRDTDQDGVDDGTEDVNCNNAFDSQDLSDSRNPDTDGDGTYDVEIFAGSDAKNPYQSPNPRIISSQPFDLDGDGESDPVVWKPTTGIWTFWLTSTSQVSSIQFGSNGDIPFTYSNTNIGLSSNIGVVHDSGGTYSWLFNGPGFRMDNGSFVQRIDNFGRPGDYLIPGPWETPGQTSPAIARPDGGTLTFYRYGRNGTWVYMGSLGYATDIPIPGNFDGTGLFKLAVYRGSQNLALIYGQSAISLEKSTFPGGVFVAGDLSADGKFDLSFFNPHTTKFTSLTSDLGFNAAQGNQQIAPYYGSLSFSSTSGQFVPLNYFKRGGKTLYTIVEHSTGRRIFRMNNNPNNPPVEIQFGSPGDWQG